MRTYNEEYKRKLISAKEAASLVQNEVVEYGAFATKPYDFDQALGDRVGEPGLNVVIRATGSLLPLPGVITKDPNSDTFQYVSGYFTALDRALGDAGKAMHAPIHYSQASMFGYNAPSQRVKCNFWAAQTTPMDKHGCFNFGIGNSHNRGCALNARVAVVEVNQNMPYVQGGTDEYVHISEIDYIIEGSNTPVFCTPAAPPPTPEEQKIAELIIEDIHDGSCIQLGIGALPDLIGHMIAKSDLKDLGVQSEMFCDSMVAMYDQGKITNARKSYDINKSTFSFCLGTQETYDFIDRNPQLASCRVDYVNVPGRIALQDNFVSINNILEVDLFSQVCSESSGIRQISGTGGQMDFVEGAFLSKGGKSFLAFSSTFTDKNGKMHSRIRPLLQPGGIVTVPRTSVHWLVTEYGKANMKLLSIWGRAEAMINLAHPDFRDDLIKAAHEMKIWRNSNKLWM